MKHAWSCLVAAGLPLLVASRPALACGGCFAPPSETSVVTGHRMAFAVSPERTVLWDKFEYDGSPEDFAWVLPVAPGATIEVASDAWFGALETVTTTTVYGPQQVCATEGDRGCALGGSDSASSGLDGFYDDGVRVLHEGTVGPFETYTLEAANGDSLLTWLNTHGYAIASDIEPVVDAYASEGANFIALRLSPGQGIQQMTPVRVVTPGGAGLLPLRMVAAGTGPFVDIVLYVIGEGRYAMPDLSEMVIDPEFVTWNFSTSTSDYASLREDALAAHGGRSYLVTFAQQQPFGTVFTDPFGAELGYFPSDGGTSASTLAELYFLAGQVDATGNTAAGCSHVLDMLESDGVVSSASDAEVSASRFECAGLTDLSTALVGMHPSNVWLTRLEMNLPREALDADCVVTPATVQEPVSQSIVPERTTARTCPEPIFTSRVASAPPGRVAPWILAALALLLGARRSFSARRVKP